MLYCTACNYSTINKHYFTKHQNTKKHKKLHETINTNITINIIGETISIYKPSKLANIISNYVDLNELSKDHIKDVNFTSTNENYIKALDKIVKNEKYIDRFEGKLKYLDLAVDINTYKINANIIQNLVIIVYIIFHKL